MSVVKEPEVKWNPDQMVEVTLNEPEDFLKVRETLTRIGVASRKEKKIYQSAIYYINKEDTFLFILKNFSLWMVNMQILQSMMYSVVIELLNYLLIGGLLVSWMLFVFKILLH